MKKGQFKIILILILSVFGLLISLYSAWDSVMIHNTLKYNSLFCNFLSINKCITINASKYSSIGTIPVAWFGFLYYWWIITSLSFQKVSKSSNLEFVLFIAASFALVISIYLSIVLISLKTFCIFCILIHLINFLIFIFTIQNIAEIIDWMKKGHLFSAFYSLLFLLIVGIILFLVASRYYIKKSDLINVEPDRQESTAVSINAFRDSTSVATVKIVAIIDYSCPYCKFLCLNLPDLIIDYKDQVEINYVYYPLNSALAAKTAICAKEYNEFNYFHYQMFLHQDLLDSLFIVSLLRKRHIDIYEFFKKVNSENIINKLNSDISIAQSIGCKGIPDLIINDKIIDNWNNSKLVKQYIESEIENSRIKLLNKKN